VDDGVRRASGLGRYSVRSGPLPGWVRRISRLTEQPRTGGLVTVFLDRDGRAWRPHDVTEIGGKIQPAAKTLAPMRLFVVADRERRLYRFQPGDIRDLIPEHLQRQLDVANVLREDHRS
jgi:hypothetical protein